MTLATTSAVAQLIDPDGDTDLPCIDIVSVDVRSDLNALSISLQTSLRPYPPHFVLQGEDIDLVRLCPGAQYLLLIDNNDDRIPDISIRTELSLRGVVSTTGPQGLITDVDSRTGLVHWTVPLASLGLGPLPTTLGVRLRSSFRDTLHSTAALLVEDHAPAGWTEIIVGVDASALIGPAGGTLEIHDPASPVYGARCDVPPGSLVETRALALRASPPPEFLRDVIDGPTALEALPHGVRFQAPVRLTIPSPRDPGSEPLEPIKSDESRALYVHAYTVTTTAAGREVFTFHTRTFSWFGVGHQPAFPKGTVYYLHSEDEGGYPLNGFRAQECTEYHPSCEPGDQWPLTKRTVADSVRSSLAAAAGFGARCLSFQNVHDVDSSVHTFENFIEFLEQPGRSLAQGLIIGFQADDFWFDSADQLGVAGWLKTSPLPAVGKKIKTILLMDRPEFYVAEPGYYARGWRVALDQYHSDEDGVNDYFQHEESETRATFSLETTLLHEVGHVLSLSHDNWFHCTYQLHPENDPECRSFPVMRPIQDLWTVAHRWEASDSNRLRDVYSCSSNETRIYWEDFSEYPVGSTPLPPPGILMFFRNDFPYHAEVVDRVPGLEDRPLLLEKERFTAGQAGNYLSITRADGPFATSGVVVWRVKVALDAASDSHCSDLRVYGWNDPWPITQVNFSDSTVSCLATPSNVRWEYGEPVSVECEIDLDRRTYSVRVNGEAVCNAQPFYYSPSHGVASFFFENCGEEPHRTAIDDIELVRQE